MKDLMDSFHNILEYWHVKAVVSMIFVYIFGDIMALLWFVILFVFVDLAAKWNAIAYQAREKYANGQGGFMRGIYLAWHHDMLDPDQMRQKFVPKCAWYLFLMILAALAMKGLKEIECYDLLELPKSVFLYIVLTELKSISKNLKDAKSPLYGLVSKLLYMYYDRKGYTQQPEVVEVPEDRPKAGNH